jgi:cyclopropane fatty-acyl-phospholipid synthase-like methyltransferase
MFTVNSTLTKSCPACKKQTIRNLETIKLESQHSLYAPDNHFDQQELTRLASLSSNQYTILKCDYCGLEYADPMESPNKNWYEKAYSILNLYPTERWEFNYALKQLTKTDVIGEIGCGSGAFLNKCQNEGIKCFGLDFSDTAIKNCLQQNLCVSLISITDFSNNNFVNQSKNNHIFSFHTLEHLDNPGDLFTLAYHWSLDNSNLWISIPSDRRLTRIHKEIDFLDQPPHHLTRWNPTSLKEVGSRYGWQLEEIIYEPIPFKTLLWSYTTRLKIYQNIFHNKKIDNLWQERVCRYFLYPLAAIKWLLSPVKITGFSMLAKYSKN